MTKIIGKNIERLREKAKLEIEDVAAMTGFHRNTIISIENGANTDISHLIEIAFALNMQPKELFALDFKIKTRYPLPATRKEKNRLTSRIATLLNSGFFNVPRANKDVRNRLIEEYPEAHNIATKNISVILKRKVDARELKIKKSGRRNLYQSVTKR